MEEEIEQLKMRLKESENIRASLGEQVAELERALAASRGESSSGGSRGRDRESNVAHRGNKGFRNWAFRGRK